MAKFKDLSGVRFGRWLVIEKAERPEGVKRTSAYWKCKCDCGNVRVVSSRGLLSGTSQSCGCLIVEKHQTQRGLSNSKLYNCWRSMKKRCYTKSCKSYPNYGGRGIKICEEWKDDFLAFYEWAVNNGYADNLSIDRIDNDKGYFPDNCRWVDATVQNNNRRNNDKIVFQGMEKSVSEWSRITGINRKTISERLKRGWSVEQALKEG